MQLVIFDGHELMINRIYTLIIPVLVLSALLVQCNREEPRFRFENQGRETPFFSSDSAFQFVEEQVNFGPRNPNSRGHQLTKEYLENTLSRYAGSRNVYVQAFRKQGYEEELELFNIITAFNPGSNDRILLCAHWDTRPRAEEDPGQPRAPIRGADDGGSGVGVLLELARLFSEHPPPVGVDIILFDGEDYGEREDLQNYFLGSRYWADNPPVPRYQPRFGILLDMVGGENAVFPKERYSLRFAPSLVEALWDIGAELGYENYFLDEEGALISDDHVIIERLADIRMIDIIHHRRSANGSAVFPPYWHTHG
ncbi:MAG: M28 family peptidase, partial [Balneolaceae bacterium]